MPTKKHDKPRLVNRRRGDPPSHRDLVLLRQLVEASIAMGTQKSDAAQYIGFPAMTSLERGNVVITEETLSRAQGLLRASAERWADKMLVLTATNMIDEDCDRAAVVVRGMLFDTVGAVANTWMKDIKLQLAYALEAGLVTPERRQAVMDFIDGPGLEKGTQPKPDPQRVAELRRAGEEIAEQERS